MPVLALLRSCRQFGMGSAQSCTRTSTTSGSSPIEWQPCPLRARWGDRPAPGPLIRESVDLTLFQEAQGSTRALVPGVWDTCCSQPGFGDRHGRGVFRTWEAP